MLIPRLKEKIIQYQSNKNKSRAKWRPNQVLIKWNSVDDIDLSGYIIQFTKDGRNLQYATGLRPYFLFYGIPMSIQTIQTIKVFAMAKGGRKICDCGGVNTTIGRDLSCYCRD